MTISCTGCAAALADAEPVEPFWRDHPAGVEASQRIGWRVTLAEGFVMPRASMLPGCLGMYAVIPKLLNDGFGCRGD